VAEQLEQAKLWKKGFAANVCLNIYQAIQPSD
jgi:hypothetical protein